jgi:hypothetical protein
MKLCPYCSGEMEDAATVCQHCGRDWKSGVSHFAPVHDIPRTTSSVSSLDSDHASNVTVSDGIPDNAVILPNHRNIGRVYGAVTLALLVAIVGSWQCWESQNVGHHPTETLRDVCLGIWVVSGVLLAVSQLFFIGVALRIRDSAVPIGDLAPGASPPKIHANVTKVLMLVGGLVILGFIALFIFALSVMPS